MAGQRKIEMFSTPPTIGGQLSSGMKSPGRVTLEQYLQRDKSLVTAKDVEQHFSNYSKLVDRVVDVFGDEIAASKWLSTPNADFAQKSPLQVARDDAYQMTALEPVLIKIEHGVYF
jgi:uncharacterized protein (DUF2384 family)